MPDRLIDLTGTAMVVTDLHGSRLAFDRLRDKFVTLHRQGKADRLVFCGDLIHPDEPDTPDDSLNMLLDIMRLQRDLGREQVMMLLGNHEVPHIYAIPLSKGNMLYTPPFEAALVKLDADPNAEFKRADVIDWLIDLPFYARTRAGVTISHAGTDRAVATVERLRAFLATDHRALLQRTRARLAQQDLIAARHQYERITGSDYAAQARKLLAVTDANDPRYDDLLVGLMISNTEVDFQRLWDALFNSNEHMVGLPTYTLALSTFLESLTELSPHEQRVLVAGHIVVGNGGYTLVGEQQLRLASYAHARPRESGRYLLLDCDTPVQTAADLIPMLHNTFPTA